MERACALVGSSTSHFISKDLWLVDLSKRTPTGFLDASTPRAVTEKAPASRGLPSLLEGFVLVSIRQREPPEPSRRIHPDLNAVRFHRAAGVARVEADR